MTTSLKTLGQSRPSGTSPVVLFTATAQTIVRSLYCCNTSGAAANASIFVAQDGVTFDESTAIFWDVPVTNGAVPVSVPSPIFIESGAVLAVQSDTGSALTFTASGLEYSV